MINKLWSNTKLKLITIAQGPTLFQQFYPPKYQKGRFLLIQLRCFVVEILQKKQNCFFLFFFTDVDRLCRQWRALLLSKSSIIIFTHFKYKLLSMIITISTINLLIQPHFLLHHQPYTDNFLPNALPSFPPH
jgi:hypothetical protein